MAKQTILTELLVDDLDGSPAERTIAFSWDGSAYEIELSAKNAVTFDKLMKPYVDSARVLRGARGRAPARTQRRDMSAVRQWAEANGYEISARGRVSTAIADAYAAAHS